MNTTDDNKNLSALIDGTLSASDAARVRAQIDADPALRAEYESMLALRRDMRDSLAPPEVREEEWEAMALRIVSKGSQRLGWTLLTPGAAALIVGALVSFFLDPTIPLWERVAAGGVVAGLAFLLLCAISDRARALRVERYDKVDR